MENVTSIYLLLLVKFSFASCRIPEIEKISLHLCYVMIFMNLTQTEIHNHKIIDINFPNCKHSITSY